MKPINLRFINLTGPSMSPTLRTGETLEIIPYDGQKIGRGDVILFPNPLDVSQKVVHRIISVDSQGIRTKGDNSNQVDSWILSPDQILGRVLYARKRNKRRRVFGGTMGLVLAKAARAANVIDLILSYLLRPVYHRLLRTDFFRRLVPVRLRPRVLLFYRPEGTELQLLMGRLVIGRWLPRMARWCIRRPFRLFVDEASLPRGGSHPPIPSESRLSDIDEKTNKNSPLVKHIRHKVQGLKLCGSPKDSLLDVSDDLLTYISSLLRNEVPLLPKATLNQWSDLISRLEPHWILPFIYWRIGSFPSEIHPPEPIMNHLRRVFMASRVKCFHMERQLREIIDTFQDKGIRMLVLRGPALAWSLYPDPALRPCGDLDLLVLPEQTVKARAILESLGYKCLSKRFEIAKDFFREEDFIHQQNPKDNLMIDLHWANWEIHSFLGKSNNVGVEELFYRGCKVYSSAPAFETLEPVDALIQAAMHLAMIHSQDMRLIWIYDITLLARHLRVPDDWEVLQERSVAWRARLAVENSLKMSQIWCGFQLPDRFNDFSSWPQPTTDEKAIWLHSLKSHWVAVLLKRCLSSPSGLYEMARSSFRLLFPPPDIIRYCYPPSRDWLLPLSYFRRLYRWFRKLTVNRINPSRKRNRF